MDIALRIDVDTFRGTRDGVPALCRLLAKFEARATFFFSVGPDNMGRHLWRLLRPRFMLKMLRSQAASLYGWDILLKGTLWPGPIISRYFKQQILAAAAAGHEIGLHAWDHHAWQAHVASWPARELNYQLQRGLEALAEIVPPTCSAAPGWRCTESALLAKEGWPFAFNSDCRGHSLFRPVVKGQVLSQPQVPVSLPTYDEAIGRGGVTPTNYNAFLLKRIAAQSFNVLTIHAEVEGIRHRQMFHDFLAQAQAQGHKLVALGHILPASPVMARGAVVRGHVAGREGWVSVHSPLTDEAQQGNHAQSIS
ncbi:MAG: 4-deoxy-4-formamido-L-arabinose-phosphoundecaprenol deformylase [Lentisphaerae bacterium]|nr:4-deoxy-4-formamido-L-arabinose-phosphoundecaprenol deformylase [Lentisphaerota bacterium]